MIKDYPLHFPPVLIGEQEQVLHKAVRDFVDREIMPIRERLEDDVALQNKVRQLLVDMGLQKLSMPKEYGGEGVRGTVLNALICEDSEEMDRRSGRKGGRAFLGTPPRGLQRSHGHGNHAGSAGDGSRVHGTKDRRR